MKLMQFPRALYERDQHQIYNDFHYYVSGETFTSLASDTNTSVSVSDAAGGILVLFTGDGVDNNEVGAFSTKEILKFADGKPLLAEARVQYSEINTSAANVFFGMADAPGANTITDNGGAVAISNSGVCIYKLDGGTVWRCYSKNGSSTADSVSTTTAGGSSYQTLRIEGRPIDSAQMELTFFCDDQPLRDSNSKAIKHTITYTSATEMKFGAYAKAGGTGQLTVNVDYLAAVQKR